MFEEFDPKAKSKDQRRMGASLLVSGVVYLGIAGGVVAASAAARQAVKEEELVQVEFAAPPEPEPPPVEPPPPPPAATPPSPRPKAQRKELTAPKEIPKEKPAEADRPLAEAPPPGAGQEGFTDGVVGGTGTAPAAPIVPAPAPARASGPVHLPENASPVVAKSGNAMPAYPEDARKGGVQGAVVAKLVIGSDGAVKSVEILRGPEVFHAVVKATLLSWRFEPARLPDGTAISVFKLVSLPFKLDNL
jgi:periplasmic protein TonB